MTYTEAPKPGKIVVGIDGSPASLEALRWAMRQATLTGSRLEVVVTWEWPQSYGWTRRTIRRQLTPERRLKRRSSRWGPRSPT